jgi:hypothetical protein
MSLQNDTPPVRQRDLDLWRGICGRGSDGLLVFGLQRRFRECIELRNSRPSHAEYLPTAST